MTTTEISLTSPQRLQELLQEAERELQEIQPRIEELEKLTQELKSLKLSKQRLITLKMSLTTMLDNLTIDNVESDSESSSMSSMDLTQVKSFSFEELSTLKSFHPDKAFMDVERFLKQKQSLNYEMFKAVVFKGGKASTEEIKAFLVESGAQQPQTGEGFEDVPLTEISSRANYLVRKGVLQPMGRGYFFTPLGWVDPE